MATDAELRFETPERVALTLDVAGLGDRAFAWLIDVFCVFLLWITALLVYSISGDLLKEWQTFSLGGQLVAIIAVFVAGWGWDVLWETLGGGRTPGKRVLGLRVVRSDGEPVGLPESLARNVLRAIELPFGYAPGVLMIALGARRQRLGDLVAGTVVVQEHRFDLSRYGEEPLTASDPRFINLKSRVAGAIDAIDYDRLLDFLKRRSQLDAGPRARIALVIGAALASRVGLKPPAAEDSEGFLEAFAEHCASHGRKA